MLNKQIDLVERRVLRDETIPVEEKIHCLYIPAVVMPKKGKKNKAEQEEESSKTFKKLRHKHSAVESDINRLEHHGLDRCPDKGLNAFKRYCALGVLAANLHKLGNVLQEKAWEQCEKSRKAA